MNKFKRKLASMLAVGLTAATLTGCGEVTYTADSGFFYSSDKGHTYGDGTKEFAVGETVYMKVKFKVTSNQKDTSQVKCQTARCGRRKMRIVFGDFAAESRNDFGGRRMLAA
ncbi:MAG: hypothetical protein IKO10_06145 [Lachnospiraceae bacterium]|nr:hypothetical protein [Lachnospiraceae bacterium]